MGQKTKLIETGKFCEAQKSCYIQVCQPYLSPQLKWILCKNLSNHRPCTRKLAIRSGYIHVHEYPCKPIGCQSKLLGAVVQTLYLTCNCFYNGVTCRLMCCKYIQIMQNFRQFAMLIIIYFENTLHFMSLSNW